MKPLPMILGADGKPAVVGAERVEKQQAFNPLRNWTPDILTMQLEAYARGHIVNLALPRRLKSPPPRAAMNRAHSRSFALSGLHSLLRRKPRAALRLPWAGMRHPVGAEEESAGAGRRRWRGGRIFGK